MYERLMKFVTAIRRNIMISKKMDASLWQCRKALNIESENNFGTKRVYTRGNNFGHSLSNLHSDRSSEMSSQGASSSGCISPHY